MDRVAGSYTIVTGGVEMQSHSYTLREWGVSYPSGGPSTQTRTYTLPRMAFSWNEAVGTWSGELTVQSFTFQ